MKARYSIRREPESIELPFGASGVAAVAAGIAGLIGLLMPTAVLETIAFQLYLDRITDLALPPLGMTAKLSGALALALVAGTLAFTWARWANVVATPDGLAGLLDRIRGVGTEDEDDAPSLRSADRHPDAPARRPFSAARDISPRDWADSDFDGAGVSAPADDDNNQELLLDTAYMPDPDDAAVVRGTIEPPERASDVIAPGATVAFGLSRPFIDEMRGIDLSPPALEDWETASGPAPEQAFDSPSEPFDNLESNEAATVVPSPARPGGQRVPRALDLSAARLDELIARLESGLTRRAPAVQPSTDAATGVGTDNIAVDQAEGPDQQDDPEFPYDPALAAALATLRKMNLRAA